MDWLKDKKNQPVVAAILAVVVLGAIVLLYMQMSGGGGGDDAPVDTTAPVAEAPPVDVTATAPDPSAAAPAAEATSSAPVVASAGPMETWRSDPFLPIGYKPPRKSNAPKPKPRIVDFPFIKFPAPPKKIPPEQKPEPPQPVRRMAGVLLNERVYAIIETNGQAEIVQPGAVLRDRLARVEKIEPDKVVLKTLTDNPRYLVVRMASAAKPVEASPAASPTAGPRGPRPGWTGEPGPMGPGGMPPAAM